MITQKIDSLNRRNPNSEAEHIIGYGWDTVYWGKKSADEDFAVIGNANLFDEREKKHQILKSNDFPLANGKVVRVLGLAIKTNIKPADLKNLLPFENNSWISVNIEDTDYSNIPVAHLLQYNRVAVGEQRSASGVTDEIQQLADDPLAPADNEIWYNTTDKQLKYFDGVNTVIIPDIEFQTNNVFIKPGDFTYLVQPIDPPHQGSIRLQFNPGVLNMITDSVEKYGIKFGAGVIDSVDSPVYYLQVMWIGQIIRTKTR